MIGSDTSRAYCLEMICADFLAGAPQDGDYGGLLLASILHLAHLLPRPDQQQLVRELIKTVGDG